MEFLVPIVEGENVENRLRWADDCDCDSYIEDVATDDCTILTNSGNGADSTSTKCLWEDLDVAIFQVNNVRSDRVKNFLTAPEYLY